MTSATLKQSPSCSTSDNAIRPIEVSRTTRFAGAPQSSQSIGDAETAVINQIRGFLLERGLPVRQGAAALRLALPRLLSMLTDDLSPRVVRLIHDLAEDWRYLDRRVACITKEIDELADQDAHCRRLMSAPGVGPIISSAMVAAIGTGDAFAKGRDFEHGLVWYRNKSRPAIEPFSAAYRGAVTVICEHYSFRGPEPYF